MISTETSAPVKATLADNGELAIDVTDLSKTYSDGLVFRKRFNALKGVTLSVKQGEIFGLLGPNGAGKTTFLKIMLGIIRKTSGSASMLGLPAGSREGRRKVGYLPEHLRVPAHLTGYQALECFGNLSNVPTSVIREKRGELLELVGLSGRAKDRVTKYSKGMLQRLGLAQALLHEPKLLVLDEPTDGLDPRARAEMRAIIRKLQNRGVTVFLNSHLLQEVEMVCQRVAILDKGNLRYCGAVDKIGEFIGQQVTRDGGVAAQELVELQIRGDADAINACFTGRSFEVKSRAGNDFTVELGDADQAAVDSLIDGLRSSGISLLGLQRKRLTLEDAFLQIIDEQSSRN